MEVVQHNPGDLDVVNHLIKQPHCFSVAMAGGGVRGGVIHGASDRIGAYPTTEPVTPGDIVATLYHLLGVDPATWVQDQLGRPFALVEGRPVLEVL